MSPDVPRRLPPSQDQRQHNINRSRGANSGDGAVRAARPVSNPPGNRQRPPAAAGSPVLFWAEYTSDSTDSNITSGGYQWSGATEYSPFGDHTSSLLLTSSFAGSTIEVTDAGWYQFQCSCWCSDLDPVDAVRLEFNNTWGLVLIGYAPSIPLYAGFVIPAVSSIPTYIDPALGTPLFYPIIRSDSGNGNVRNFLVDIIRLRD